MTVRQYVETNFTEIEKSLFEYLVSSFPESMLVINNQESQDTLALLATLTKVIGSSKELILNLKTGHSIEEVFNKIENGYLVDNNKNLLLPLAADLNYHRLSDSLETDELISRLIEEKPFVLDYYNLYKNRGTLTAITQIVKKFAVFLNRDDLPFNVYEFDTEMDIILENVGQIEKFGDFTQGDFNLTINDELVEVVPIKKDNILFDMLMKIKPVGFAYNVLLKYMSGLILNLIEDRIIEKEGRESIFDPEVFASQQLLNVSLPQIEDLTITENTSNYNVEIKNVLTAVSLEAYVADWSAVGIISSANRFEDLLYRVKQITSTVVVYGQDVANRKNFIFDTKSSLDAYVASAQPNPGNTLIVTGFRWDLVTEAAFNSATNKVTVTDTLTTGNAPDVFDMEVRTLPSLATRNQFPSGDIVIRFVRTVTSTSETFTRYFRLVTVTTGGFPNAQTTSSLVGGIGFFLLIGFKNFSFEKYIISPNSILSIDRTSTDPDYAGMSQHLGVYFTNVGRSTEKTPNLIVPFNNPQQININANPIALTLKPKTNETLIKQITQIQPLPAATLVPNSISKTSSVISGVLANNNTNNIANVNTQIRLLNNSTGIFGAWQTLATASNFRNNIVFSFSGLSANTQHTFQVRNTTSTQGFEPTSSVNQYQETTQSAQQLNAPVFEPQDLQIGNETFTVGYRNTNNVNATLVVLVDEIQEFQEVLAIPSGVQGTTTQVTFSSPEFQIDPGTEYTVRARFEAAGFTSSQFAQNIIETTGGVEPPTVTATPTLTALQATSSSSISFTLNNQQQDAVKFEWEVSTTVAPSVVVAERLFSNAGSTFKQTNENIIVTGLDPETEYRVKARALGDGNYSASLFTAFQNVTTQAVGLDLTTTPTTAVIGQTESSVTFRITNADALPVNVQYEIATAQTGGTVIKSGSNISLLDPASFPGSEADRIDITANTGDGVQSSSTYFLRSVFAKADGKALSEEGTIRSTTTPAATVTATFTTSSGSPSTYTEQTGESPLSVTQPSPNPTKTGFVFNSWSPALPTTINANTLFTSIYRLRQPTINLDPSDNPMITVNFTSVSINFSNNNTGNFANVQTQLRVAVSGAGGDWVTIANFPNNQTNLTHEIATLSDGTPLDPNTQYTFLLRNVPVQTGTTVLTSSETTFAATTGEVQPPPQRVVRAILSTSEATSGVSVQYEITGPGNYDESGTVQLNSTSFTFLETTVPDDSVIALNVPTSFVSNDDTWELQFISVNAGTINDFNVPAGGLYEISDVSQNTDISITYIEQGTGGGASGGGGNNPGPGEGLEGV